MPEASSLLPCSQASYPWRQGPISRQACAIAARHHYSLLAKSLIARMISMNVSSCHHPAIIHHPEPWPAAGAARCSGGPGFESPRVIEAAGWLKAAANNFRIILMDQRGTGRSQPVTVANLNRHGTAEQQAHYLSFFRSVKLSSSSSSASRNVSSSVSSSTSSASALDAMGNISITAETSSTEQQSSAGNRRRQHCWPCPPAAMVLEYHRLAITDLPDHDLRIAGPTTLSLMLSWFVRLLCHVTAPLLMANGAYWDNHLVDSVHSHTCLRHHRVGGFSGGGGVWVWERRGGGG